MDKAVTISQNPGSITNQVQLPQQEAPQNSAPAITGLETLEKAAEYVVKSGLFGVTRKEQAIALMLLAQAEGVHPMRAIQEYHIIQGKPSLRADAILARFQKAGGRVIWHELTDKKAKATFEHPLGGKVTIEWTIEMAKQAGLLDKQGSNWKKYPRAMLRARTVSEGVRTVYPAATVGFYTPEEMQDMDLADLTISPQVVENGDIIDIETGEITEEKPKWDLTKIREIATEELKMVVKKYRIPTTEVIALFEKFNGDQKAIIDYIKKLKETKAESAPEPEKTEKTESKLETSVEAVEAEKTEIEKSTRTSLFK